MPVREKAVGTAFHALMDGTSAWFNNTPGRETANIDGVEMTREEFDRRFMQPLERIYEHVVESIDWNRVLIEAMQRHIALDHPEHLDYNLICPECLNESLLADATHNDWKANPKAPRYHTGPPNERTT